MHAAVHVPSIAMRPHATVLPRDECSPDAARRKGEGSGRRYTTCAYSSPVRVIGVRVTVCQAAASAVIPRSMTSGG
jgi:hypothetical protein